MHLLNACRKGKVKSVKRLLKSKHISKRCLNRALSCTCATSGDKQIINILMKYGAITSTNKWKSALYIACVNKKIEATQALLKWGANANQYYRDETILHVARYERTGAIAKLLLSYGANCEKKDSFGRSALLCACYFNNIEMVRELIEKGANINTKNEHGHSPFYVACQYGYFKLAKFLLQKGSLVSKSKDSDNILFIVSMNPYPDIEIIRFLIEESKINVNKFCPLHELCKRGNCEIVKYLLEHGANPNLRNKWNITPLEAAYYWGISNNRKLVIDLLLDYGADIQMEFSNGFKLITMACKGGDHEIITSLLKRGIKISSTEINAYCLLNIPGIIGNLDLARLLLKNGACIDGTDGDNGPLITSCINSHPSVASYLLDRGASPNAYTSDDDIPLHIACKCHNTQTIRVLVQYGANVNVMTEDGLTALKIACSYDFPEIAKLLLDLGASRQNIQPNDKYTARIYNVLNFYLPYPSSFKLNKLWLHCKEKKWTNTCFQFYIE